ncbi:MAG TPA: pseudouridine synthase, partial [Casimicrobiaceae bacterium]
VGQKVGPGDEVRINGELVKVRFAEPRPRVLMYHKPAGELVTRDDPEGRPTVFERLPPIGNGRWINVGRLDYNSEGLLLFTNSGELANRLMHPRYEVEREYAVRVMGRLTEAQMQGLTNGIELEDGRARCEQVRDAGGDEDGANHWYHVVLKEGRNREVRRLFEALGLMVSRLIRTRYGALAMPTHLKRGNLAELEGAEVEALMSAAGLRAAPGRPAQHRDPRSARGPKGQGAHAAGARPAKLPRRRPHAGAGLHASAIAQPRPGDGETAPMGGAAPASRPLKQHSPQQRHGKNRGGPGKPKDGGGPRAQHEGSRRKPIKPHGHGPRPQRPRHDFDEVQPQSNANAAPFGRTTLTVPGGVPRGYGHDASPRQRSGPRAQRAAGANGQIRGDAAGYQAMNREVERGYSAPARPASTPQVRTKRRRVGLPANPASEASGGVSGSASPEDGSPPKDDRY